jgi:hypothetical protein
MKALLRSSIIALLLLGTFAGVSASITNNGNSAKALPMPIPQPQRPCCGR